MKTQIADINGNGNHSVGRARGRIHTGRRGPRARLTKEGCWSFIQAEWEAVTSPLPRLLVAERGVVTGEGRKGSNGGPFSRWHPFEPGRGAPARF